MRYLLILVILILLINNLEVFSGVVAMVVTTLQNLFNLVCESVTTVTRGI